MLQIQLCPPVPAGCSSSLQSVLTAPSEPLPSPAQPSGGPLHQPCWTRWSASAGERGCAPRTGISPRVCVRLQQACQQSWLDAALVGLLTVNSWLHSSVAACTTTRAWVSSFCSASTSVDACSSFDNPPGGWMVQMAQGVYGPGVGPTAGVELIGLQNPSQLCCQPRLPTRQPAGHVCVALALGCQQAAVCGDEVKIVLGLWAPIRGMDGLQLYGPSFKASATLLPEQKASQPNTVLHNKRGHTVPAVMDAP